MRNKSLILRPWEVGVAERMKVLEEAVRKGKKIVLYYSLRTDGETFRYRVYNIYQATQKSEQWQAVYFLEGEKEEMRRAMKQCSMLVLGRQCEWSDDIEKVVKTARKLEIPVLLDLDDLVFDAKYLHLVLNTIGGLDNRAFWTSLFVKEHRTGEQVDGFWATNDFLMAKIKDCFDKPVGVIRNALNDEQMEASEAYLAIKKRHDRFTIGYFGGTPTHVNDFEVALPEVLYFLDKHPRAKLRVVGFMELDQRSEKYLQNGQIELLPFTDFRKLQRLISEVDVNIAPLMVNEFTNCKSELKFFEAGIVETTTIASPTYTFEKAIQDGENGFLAEQGEWYDKIEFLYQNPEENWKIARRAREYALKHYYGREVIKEIEEVFEQFTER